MPSPATKLQEEKRDVLVALLPNPRDLQLARVRGWYRVRSGELVERIRGGPQQFTDLAFYQPDSFGPERRCVRYSAPVLSLSQVPRVALLPEEPNHPRAKQLYFCFHLGPVEPLPRPIPALRGRRILFIPTSWERIRKAEEINDLFHESPLEDRLYHALRAAGLLPERQFHVELKDPAQPRKRGRHYFLDMAILCQQRDLDVECDGDTWHSRTETIEADNQRDNLLNANRWHVLRFNTPALQQRLDDTLQVIREAVNHYGGVVQADMVVRRFTPDGHLASGQATLDFPE